MDLLHSAIGSGAHTSGISLGFSSLAGLAPRVSILGWAGDLLIGYSVYRTYKYVISKE